MLTSCFEKKTSEKIKDSIQETLIVLAGVYQDASFEDWFMLETLVESSIGSMINSLIMIDYIFWTIKRSIIEWPVTFIFNHKSPGV